MESRQILYLYSENNSSYLMSYQGTEKNAKEGLHKL